jgi:hypothetical protein
MFHDTQPEQPQSIPITDMLYFAKTAAKRDRKGSHWCERKGMGRDRAALERAWRINVRPLFLRNESMGRALVHSADDAKRKLASFCAECPLSCEMRGK